MSSVSSIANNSTATSAASSATDATTDLFTNPKSTLNQTDFLQLLVAQIQYQDPLNPQSNTDMAAQLAQFTALQQATQSSSSLSMMQANGLVGSTVTLQVDSNTTASGVVTGVVMSNGTPEITVNGTNYNLSQVTSVTPTVASTTANATSSSTTPSSTAASTTGASTTAVTSTSATTSNQQATQ
jgi:flagellar basal-body rod modification protein FlgD